MLKFAVVFLAICVGSIYATAGLPGNCTTYCNLFLQNCNASNSGNITFYSDFQNCMDVCASFPIGYDNETSGNSVGCRTYHAGAPALADPAFHCPHASSHGGFVCGDYCDAYCSIGRFNCNPTNGWPLEGSSDLWNTGDSGCHTICNTIYDVGVVGNDFSGNTLACRLYHAQASYSLGLVHCSHASPNGEKVCGNDTCVNYCQQIFTTCPTVYTDVPTCLSYCNANLKYAPGGFNTTGDDTLGCRLYHNGAVPVLGAAHCLHADQSGGNVCGSYCQVYCDLVQKNCVGNNQQYPDTATCMTACNNMPANGTDNATGGDTVQCRIYHAGVAGNPPANAQAHCPHAGQNGAGVCGGTAPTSTAATTTTATATSAKVTTGTATTTSSPATTASSSTVVASFFLVVALIVALL